MEEKDQKIVDAIQIDYKKMKSFTHCKNCIEQFLGSDLNKVMTPKEYGQYEVGFYDFTYPDGHTAEIPVVWCKRCGDRVWDGRNYTKTY